MLKRLLSLVMTTIIVLSAFTAFPVSVNAEKATELTDSADTYSPTEDNSAISVPTEPATELESEKQTEPNIEQPSDAPIATEAPTEKNEDSFNTVEKHSKPELASTCANGETYEQAARYVPNYVITGSDTIQPMYNPYTVQMLFDMSLSAYEISNSDDWSYALVSHRYSQVYRVENNAVYGINDSTNILNIINQNFFSSLNATIGLKQVEYNGQTKYAIAIAFRGTKLDLPDLIDDISAFPSLSGFHKGFLDNANNFYNLTPKIIFNIDGNNISLYDMIQDMKNEDSPYCMLVTGHSLGGATADVFVGYNLYNAGVKPSNVLAYTFAAPNSSPSYYSYPYKNIINIYNTDDFVPTIPSAYKRIGMDFAVDFNDDERRDIIYKDYHNSINYAMGQPASYWSMIGVQTTMGFAAHTPMDPAYQLTIDKIKDNIEDYSSYHTNGDNSWFDNLVMFNQNTYRCFDGNITTQHNIRLTDTSISCQNLRFKNELVIFGDCAIKGNIACYESDYARIYLLSDNVVGSGKESIGKLIVDGNCKCNNLLLDNPENYLKINGNLDVESSNSYVNYNGVVECKGNFYCNSRYTEVGSENSGIMILSGNDTQKIYCRSGFYHIRILNSDIVFENKIDLTLEVDTFISNPSEIKLKELTLNNCKLTVNNTITIDSNLMMTNAELECQSVSFTNEFYVLGDCKVKGDISCPKDSYSRLFLRYDEELIGKLYIDGNCKCNNLLLQHPENYLLVNGDLTFSQASDSVSFYVGTVECKGDFYNNSRIRFGTSDNSVTIFSGNDAQKIYCTGGFSRVEITNSTERGIFFESNLNVSKLFDHKGNYFSLYNNGIGSSFVDYDGDGMLDNVDPYPTDPNNTPPVEKRRGDADGDGEVTIIDATCIQRFLAQFDVFSFDEVTADADGDGEITILDATVIQRWLAQFSSNDNIGKPIAL